MRRIPGLHPWGPITFSLLAALALLLAHCAPAEEEAEKVAFPQLEGYAPMTVPEDNPLTAAKVELGKQLYYDKRLSGDGERSCYSCHLPEHGLTDGRPVAIGAFDKKLTRSSPTMWNVGYHSEWYWDGRADTLEGQAKAAWSGGNMGASGKDGAPSVDDICAKLNGIEGYRRQFQEVFGEGCTPDNVGEALATFMRTIVSTQSAWVRFRGGDQAALSPEARRGYENFKGKARCTNCHDGLLLTDLQYHNAGIGWDAQQKKFADLGRFKVTNNERDKGAFKTPTLIDIAQSAPYFHDGSVKTLEEAVDLMLKGGIDNPHLDEANLRPPVELSEEERANLLQFLRELDAEYTVEAPELP